MKRHRLFVLIALVVIAGVALADETSRRNVISQITSKLESAASELSSMERKSDASDVDDALNYVYEVERLLEELKRVAGTDSEAEKIVSIYPGFIKEFRYSADELKKLKLRQPAAAAYLRQCETFDKEMIARAHATKDDPRGAEELSDFAKALGQKGEDLMNEASRMATEVERSRNEARRFSVIDDRWKGIRSNLQSSADAVARDWAENYDRARRACAEVMKRERHVEIERALNRLASSRAGRKQLQDKIYELLAKVAERTYNVHKQSDVSYVSNAIDITREVDSQLERLRVAAGDDGWSQELASKWPPRMRELRDSLGAMKEMKFNQSRADDGFDKCEAAEKALQDKIRQYIADPTQHQSAIRELPDDADRVGTPIRSGLDKAGEVDRQMDGWYRAARSFSYSEPGFAPITSNLRASADEVLEHWRRNFVSMTRACTRLALGKDHPDVRRAIEEMSRDTKSASDSYRTLRDEFNRWKADVDKLRDLSEKDVEELRSEFCAATDHDEVWESVSAIADRWAVQLRSLYGTITGNADRIKLAAEALIAKKRALKAAPRTRDAVDDILKSIAELQNNQFQGSHNPLVKAMAQYGTNMHTSMQRSCDGKEILISSSYCANPNPKRRDCKLDCVQGCTIVEIKPDNAAAGTLGQAQANAYKEGLEKMFRARGEDMFQKEFELFRKCMSSDKKELVLKTKIEPYKFCPSADQLAAPLKRVDPSIPSESE